MADPSSPLAEQEASSELVGDAPEREEPAAPSTPMHMTQLQDDSPPPTLPHDAATCESSAVQDNAEPEEYTAGLKAKIGDYAAQVRKIESDNAALRSRVASMRKQCTALLRPLVHYSNLITQM